MPEKGVARKIEKIFTKDHQNFSVVCVDGKAREVSFWSFAPAINEPVSSDAGFPRGLRTTLSVWTVCEGKFMQVYFVVKETGKAVNFSTILCSGKLQPREYIRADASAGTLPTP